MKKTSLILVCIFFFNCKKENEPIILFDQPQPINKKNLNSFPKRIIGTYEIDDSTFFTIKEETIYKTHNTTLKRPKDSVSLENLNKSLKHFLIKENKDSLFFEIKDTLFSIKNANNILRKLNSKYILNYNFSSDSIQKWGILILLKKASLLEIKKIDVPKDLNNITFKLDHLNLDTINQNITKKQFRKIIRQKFDSKIMIKIKD